MEYTDRSTPPPRSDLTILIFKLYWFSTSALNILNLSNASCRVHKPGVPRGLASQQRLGPSRQCATHGPAQVSEQQARRAIQSPTGRSGRGGTVSVFRLWPTPPTGALASVSSPPPDDLFDRKAWLKHYFRLRPHISDWGTTKPFSLLFSD